jgi:hypothetical protein
MRKSRDRVRAQISSWPAEIDLAGLIGPDPA